MKRTLRFLVVMAALAGGAVCAAAAVAGQFGRWSEQLDLFNHASPLWLLGGLAALVLSLAGGGWAARLAAACGAIAVLAASSQVVPVLGRHLAQTTAASDIPAQAPRVKLIQFSVYHANPTPGRAVDWLLEQKADVVVLEEGEGLDAASRARLLAAYPHRNDNGDMILSRWPMRNNARFERPPRPTSMFFMGGSSVIDGPGGPFTVVGIHYTWPWPTRFQARQRREFAKYVDTLPKETTIVAGDLNSTPWSFALLNLEQRMGLSRLTHGELTFPARQYRGDGVMDRARRVPAWFAFAPIDHVFAGGAWRAVKVTRGPKLGSDHYPLVVELARVG
jgi:endonuclease/exonuclease/phosphatase (EEP) superfamily protein YafD